jgi:hypothetical protein
MGGLGLLLLNDLILKQQFHNGLTGKVSDFAGLFILPLFLTALFPRFRRHLYVLTAFSFILWKSTYAQPLIEGWNGLLFFSIGRTVDYSDFLALLVLPFSYVYSLIPSRVPTQRVAIICVALISLFAFTATSFRKVTAYDNEYQFQIPKAELIQRMRQLPARNVGLGFGESDTFEITFEDCAANATVVLKENGNQSIIVLKEIVNRCPGGGDKLEMLQYFEKEFIAELRQERVTKSAEVSDIWSKRDDDLQSPTPQPSSSVRPVKPPTLR